MRDKRWWMWEDQASFLPTEDETHWNEMIVYLRRNQRPFPYTKYLRRRH
jgi:hypothetical protein